MEDMRSWLLASAIIIQGPSIDRAGKDWFDFLRLRLVLLFANGAKLRFLWPQAFKRPIVKFEAMPTHMLQEVVQVSEMLADRCGAQTHRRDLAFSLGLLA